MRKTLVFFFFFLVAEINLLEFKPSIIGASALLLACHELFPLQFPSFEASVLSCEFVNKVSKFSSINCTLVSKYREFAHFILGYINERIKR